MAPTNRGDHGSRISEHIAMFIVPLGSDCGTANKSGPQEGTVRAEVDNSRTATARNHAQRGRVSAGARANDQVVDESVTPIDHQRLLPAEAFTS